MSNFVVLAKTRWQKEKEAALQAQAATDLIQPREGIDLETAQLLTRMIAMKSCYDINSLIKQNKEAFYFYGQETGTPIHPPRPPSFPTSWFLVHCVTPLLGE